jgi:hypothetical protein
LLPRESASTSAGSLALSCVRSAHTDSEISNAHPTEGKIAELMDKNRPNIASISFFYRLIANRPIPTFGLGHLRLAVPTESLNELTIVAGGSSMATVAADELPVSPRQFQYCQNSRVHWNVASYSCCSA